MVVVHRFVFGGKIVEPPAHLIAAFKTIITEIIYGITLGIPVEFRPVFPCVISVISLGILPGILPAIYYFLRLI